MGHFSSGPGIGAACVSGLNGLANGNLVERLCGSFQKAAGYSACAPCVLWFGKHDIRIQIGSPELRTLVLEAFHGLETLPVQEPSCRPSLELCVWSDPDLDVLEGGWPDASLDPEDNPPVYHSSTSSYRLVAIPSCGLLCYLDTLTSRAYYHVRFPGKIPLSERCTPMRLLMKWFADANGMLMVHGAGVCDSGRGAILVGKSGSGKSTTSVGCAIRGMGFLGDDYLMLDLGGQAVARSIYRGFKLKPDVAHLMEALDARPIQPGTTREKHFAILNGKVDPFVRSSLIQVILRPRICNHDRTTFLPMSPLAALVETATSTILQLPGGESSVLASFRNFCLKLPAYEMCMSRDSDEIVEALRHFLRILEPRP
jgi:hypothetical protein